MPTQVLTKIAGKFQVTVPPEIRDAFGLQEGDLLEWILPDQASPISVVPKRAQVITPLVKAVIGQVKEKRTRKKEQMPARASA